MTKTDYYCIPWIQDYLKDANIEELKKIFFKRIFFSFFILEPKNKANFKELLLDKSYIKNIKWIIERKYIWGFAIRYIKYINGW